MRAKPVAEQDKLKDLKIPKKNLEFARLNPITLPKDFPNDKKIGVIMNKLACNQYPSSISINHENLRMVFTDNPASSTYLSYGGGSELAVPLKGSNTDFCKIIINTKDCLFKTEYRKELFIGEQFINDNNQNPFLRDIKQETMFELIAKSFLRYIPAEDESGESVNVFQTGNNFYSFIKFFEKVINTTVVRLCAIQNYNNPSKEVNLSIADFCKLCKNSFMEDYKLPKKESVNSLIDDLIYMGQSKIEKIQAGILRVTRTYTTWESCRIYLGGTIIVNEYSLSRFKYVFHPGIHLVAKYLEFYNKIDLFRHKIEKEMFKKL